ncbi:heavy metal-associated isoprenylated plant protein 36 [Amborella trichopoda]|uniref:heavy metal-associated isoprenylated plant protein 36 n=1 Tax=Amborella trichopoda TaxID=13333 RepID=UPI0005D44D2C|nr:heavy metal-associated isoprenylated plant protein 36 [Amborella trichopoda]|eukprot:XP_011623558.1 heavy metal-associated isoprenylated plant protein 36 [Amborella trichopoda]
MAGGEDFKPKIVELKVFIHCEGCNKKVKKLLSTIEGVYRTTVDPNLHKVSVEVLGSVNPDTLVKKLVRNGKKAELWQGKKPAKEEKKEQKAEENGKEKAKDNTAPAKKSGNEGNNKEEKKTVKEDKNEFTEQAIEESPSKKGNKKSQKDGDHGEGTSENSSSNSGNPDPPAAGNNFGHVVPAVMPPPVSYRVENYYPQPPPPPVVYYGRDVYGPPYTTPTPYGLPHTTPAPQVMYHTHYAATQPTAYYTGYAGPAYAYDRDRYYGPSSASYTQVVHEDVGDYFSDENANSCSIM